MSFQERLAQKKREASAKNQAPSADQVFIRELQALTDKEVEIHKAAMLGRAHDVNRLLDAAPGEVNLLDPLTGHSLLALAALGGHLGVCELLISRKADVNAQNAEGITALHVACMNGHEAIVALLLQEPSISASIEDRAGNSALHYCAGRGHLKCVERLVTHSVHVDHRNHFELTPLNCAAFNGYVGVVDALIKADASVNAKDKQGNTSLHHASAMGLTRIARQLLAHKSRVNIVNSKGESALDLAASEEMRSLILNLGTVTSE